jgi:hypothetical protein
MPPVLNRITPRAAALTVAIFLAICILPSLPRIALPHRGSQSPAQPSTTVALPAPDQAASALCVANHSSTTLHVFMGPDLAAGTAVNASVIHDFAWAFGTPYPATQRQYTDCLVLR